MLAEITDTDLQKELKVESRLQRSKLLKKVGDFRTYGVQNSLLGFDDDVPPPPDEDPPDMSRDSLDPGPANEAKFGGIDSDGEEEKYSHK